MKEGKPKLRYILSVYKSRLYSKVYSGETLGQTLEILFILLLQTSKELFTRFYASIIIFQPKVMEAHKENSLSVQS